MGFVLLTVGISHWKDYKARNVQLISPGAAADLPLESHRIPRELLIFSSWHINVGVQQQQQQLSRWNNQQESNQEGKNKTFFFFILYHCCSYFKWVFLLHLTRGNPLQINSEGNLSYSTVLHK